MNALPKTSSQPDLTVIVPVYNAMEHLQTLVNDMLSVPDVGMELILVDDGSSDGSTEAIHTLAAAHPEVIALENPGNMGAGVARNTGFPHASGRYTLFFDADDRVHGEVIAPAIAQLDKSGADVAMFAYNYQRDTGAGRTGMLESDALIWRDGLRGKPNRICKLADIPALLGFTNYPWNKIIRTDRFHAVGLTYGDTKVNNDILGHWYSLLFARDLLLIDQVLCSHIVFAAGTNITNRRDAVRMEMFRALHATYDLLSANPDLRQRYSHHYWGFALKLLDWGKSRLSPEYLEAHRAATQDLIARLDLRDYARIRRKRAPALATRIMNIMLS